MSQRTPAETLRINNAIVEANARLAVLAKITNRKYTQAEKLEANALMSRVASLRAGYGLEEVSLQELNAIESRDGLDITRLSDIKSEVREMRLADLRTQVLDAGDRQYLESRGGEGGIGSNTPGSYAGLGYFVPTGFVRDTVTIAQKAADAILNPDNVTYLRTKTGNPISIPAFNDTDQDQDAIGEGAQNTDNNITLPGSVGIGAASYRTTYPVSLEAFQDVEALGSVEALWQAVTARRIARGVGRDMTIGTGAIKGIVTQLENAGCVPIIAQGSSELTGGGETGANSIGNTDLAALIGNLDSAYRSSPKCAFWLNQLTLLKLSQLLNKYGNPIVEWDSQQAFIWGYPVRFLPSLSQIGASNVTVLFGDGAYICVREVTTEGVGVQVLKEKYADVGQVGLSTRTRWDMKLLTPAQNGGGSKLPFTILQQHS